MIKFRKIMFFLILFMTIGIIINLHPIKLNAVEDDLQYNELYEEISISNSLDQETIKEYSKYVSIVDGEYVFSGDSNDENAQFILDNINIVNDFVTSNEAYLTDDGLVFYCEDELSTQFGFTCVKWHWYGVDLSMNKDMIYTVCFASLSVNFISGQMLKRAIENQSFSNINDSIRGYIMPKVGSAAKMSSLLGSRTYSKIIDKYGDYNNARTAINSLLSTALYIATGVLTVAFFATCGVGAVVWSIISYVIGTFTPSILATTVLFIRTICNVTTTAQMRIRWLCGCGTNLYY